MALSPDGKELAFTSNNREPTRPPRPTPTFGRSRWTARRTSSPARNRTAANNGLGRLPTLLPRRALARYRTPKGGVGKRTASGSRSWIGDGESRVLTEGFRQHDRRDGLEGRRRKRIYFTPTQRAAPRSIDGPGQRPHPPPHGRGLMTHFSGGARRHLAVVSRRRVGESPGAPPHRPARDAPVAPRRLTPHNARWRPEVDIRPAEEIHGAGGGGPARCRSYREPHGFDPARRSTRCISTSTGGPQPSGPTASAGTGRSIPASATWWPSRTRTARPASVRPTRRHLGRLGRQGHGGHRQGDRCGGRPALRGRRSLGLMGWSWGGYAVCAGGALDALQGHGLDDGGVLRPAVHVQLDRGADGSRSGTSRGRRGRSPRPISGPPPPTTSPGLQDACLVLTGEKAIASPHAIVMFFTDLQKRGVPSRLVVFGGTRALAGLARDGL